MEFTQIKIDTTLHFRNRKGHIYAVVYHQKKQHYISLRLNVPMNQWDSIIEEPIQSKSKTNLDLHNNKVALRVIEKVRSAFNELIIRAHASPAAYKQLSSKDIIQKITHTSAQRSNMFSDLRQHIYNDKVKESTSAQRMSTLHSLEKYFTERGFDPKWSNLTPDVLQSFFDSLHKSAKTINVIRSHIKKMISETSPSKKKILEELLIPKETRSIEERKRNRTPLSPRQISALMRAKLKGHDKNIRDIFLFQCFTGLRVSEALSVARGNYNIDGDEIVVRQKKAKKGHISYARPLLTPQARKYLHNILNHKSFWNKDDKTLTALIDFVLKKITRKMPEFQSAVDVTKDLRGVTYTNQVPQWETITSHLARHTYVSAMCMKGIPKDVVMRATGHTDTKMIDTVYLHVDQEIERARARNAFIAAGLI